MTLDGDGSMARDPDRPLDVFISYRHDDDDLSANRIYAHLEKAGLHCFFDQTGIPAGADWFAQIRDDMSKCRVVLVIMNEKFFRYQDSAGRRRIDKEDDMCRREIQMAMDLSDKGTVKLIPVLLRGFTMPLREDFPPSIQRLCDFNAPIIHPGNVRSLNDLAELVRNALAVPPSPASPATSSAVRADLQSETEGSVPDPVVTRSSEGVVGLISRPSDTWAVILRGSDLLIETGDGSFASKRTLPFPPSSAVLSSDGRCVVVADESKVLVVLIRDDHLHFGAPIPLEGTTSLISAWYSGTFVCFARSTEPGLAQYKVGMSDSRLLQWTPPEQFESLQPWTSLVCDRRSFAVADEQGLLRACGDMKNIFGRLPEDGWISLDLSVSSGVSRSMGGLLAGLRRSADGTLSAVLGTTDNGNWQAGRTFPIPSAETVLLARPVRSSKEPIVYIKSGQVISGWNSDERIGQSSST